MITRREALKTVALTAGALTLVPPLLRADTAGAAKLTYPYKVPDLGYGYDALEPYIDTMTMQIHHDKHHAAYVSNLNKALETADPKFQQMSLEELLVSLDTLPENIRTTVRNNAGGHYNHSFLWQLLQKNESGKPTGDLAPAIDKDLGGFPAFQAKLEEAGGKVFGSGWAWLVAENGKLAIVSTPNQDCPITKKQTAIFGVDVWEHAYYLKHQNRRPEYLKAYWNVINWDYCNTRFKGAVTA